MGDGSGLPGQVGDPAAYHSGMDLEILRKQYQIC
jgi:hypothetical protein